MAIERRRNRRDDAAWEAIAALHSTGGRANFDRASAACVSSDPVERSVGADVLGQLGWKEKHPFAQDSIPLLASLLSDADDSVVVSAIYALWRLGANGIICERLDLARRQNGEIRLAVAATITGDEDREALSALFDLMRDIDDDVRDWATFSVGTQSEIDTPEVRAALTERLTDSSADVRCEAIAGLAKRRDRIVLPALETELKSPGLPALALEAAVELGAVELLPLLRSLALEGDDDGSIGRAISAIEGER